MCLYLAAFMFCVVSDRSRRRSPFCLMANSIDQRRRFTERFFRCPVNQDNLFETFCPILFFPLQRKKELSGCVVKYFIVVTVQVVKTGITPPLATSGRFWGAEMERLHHARRLHARQ